MKSIRFRVIGTYLLIIIMTITLFGVGAYSLIKNYYISNIESILNAGHDICNDIYNELYYQYDIEHEADKVGDRFVPYTEAQVMILDTEGKVIYDSIQLYQKGYVSLDKDLQRVLDGVSVTHQASSELGERIISVSRTITSQGQTIGILKLSSSLEGAYRALNQVLVILFAGGAVIVAVVSFIALILSNTIVRPVKKITDHVEDISEGNLEIKPEKKYKDEFSKLTFNLNSLATELKSNKRLREQFIASVSHELRTPLTSIKGWIITLKNSKESDRELLSEGLDIINTETDRLTGLVNGLLDFSEFSVSKRPLNLRKFIIDELAEYTYRQMKPRADRLGITMEYQNNTNSSLVMGDYDRLKQVLINIIDNALKYSDMGATVRIVTQSDNSWVNMIVADTGQGIAEADMENIFEINYQGSNAKEGNGLGLSLSKEIIESHGGTIKVESKKGTGTTVICSLKKL